MDNFQKFLTIADELYANIVNGNFHYGKPFLSRSDICEKYNISLKTAYKVQQELCKRGVIAANRGRAFIVCDPMDRGEVSLHEIRLLRQIQMPERKDYVMDELADGIRMVCEKRHIDFNEIYLDLRDKDYHKINPAGGNEPGQGIVMLPYRSIMCRGAGYFLKHWQPYRVTVDMPMPGTSGVMMDDADAVEKIFCHAKNHGAKSIMQIPHDFNIWNQLFSGQCFRFGKLSASMLGMEHFIADQPDFQDVISCINSKQPDALFFHGHLGKNIHNLLSGIKYSPQLYFVCRGEGDHKFHSGIPGAFCYTYDYRLMGSSAAELLLKPALKYPKRELLYIKGKLK